MYQFHPVSADSGDFSAGRIGDVRLIRSAFSFPRPIDRISGQRTGRRQWMWDATASQRPSPVRRGAGFSSGIRVWKRCR